MTKAAPAEAAIVMTTAGSEADAESLASAMVESRLAACVQVMPIRSFYVWRGKPQRDAEWLLLIKTRGEHYVALETFIRAHHGYETPEIVMVPVSAGSPDYLAWLTAGTELAGRP
ncbi:divalent-cation tolerance protein CutA [Phreatobacter sp. AB_2022a]|uniref:divalent-cation tolerance protein CutA n=1 Tax=Phreatobacter sp. AB_2022a TaxID=3003134 RepID=UPI0022871014|nr:divalent-cation tolerance protein CutA [Phreatobacter sp. AB_2022a]MCZ0734217.1 divalent-cation tolerance protein CutA [Phreatobacter sp. AB_2022a]